MEAGNEWEATLDRLRAEIVGVTDVSNQYIDLFGRDEARVALLNRSAAYFFATVQSLMVREVILGISRLTDPRDQGGYSNLTLRLLLDAPEVAGDKKLEKEIKTKLAAAHKKAAPMRRHRNKYIAHLDEAVALGDRTGLPKISREQLTEAVTAVGAVYRAYMSSARETDSDLTVYSLRSTDALCRALERGDRRPAPVAPPRLETEELGG